MRAGVYLGILASLGAAIILAACSYQGATDGGNIVGSESPSDNSGEEPSLDELRAKAWAEFDHEDCKRSGGAGQQQGLLGMPMCVIPFADAGKQCSDHDMCEGQCRTNDSVTDYDGQPGTQLGLCQANNSPFGCYGLVENGSAGAFLCVD